MKFIGVPVCPYCKKRVNLVRTWSLKRQGEYQCPRCGGISNIFLSPLVWVFALLAIFSGVAVYFFHKFVLDDVSLNTVEQILIPFALFFLLSLFFVYLEKPVIKKVPRSEVDKRGRRVKREEPPRQTSSQMFYDTGEYLPRSDYHTGTLPGPMPQKRESTGLPGRADQRERPHMENRVSAASKPSTARPSGARPSGAKPSGAKPFAGEPVRRNPVPQTRPAPVKTSASTAKRASANPLSVPGDISAGSPAPRADRPVKKTENSSFKKAKSFDTSDKAMREKPAAKRETARAEEPVRSKPVSEEGEVSVKERVEQINEDFFAKYDDPDYLEKRMRELERERGKNGGSHS